MNKVTVKIDQTALSRIKGRAQKIDDQLLDPQGPVLHFLFEEVGKKYRRAVMSGMGTFGDHHDLYKAKRDAAEFRVYGRLEEFMGRSETVNWQPLSWQTINFKKSKGNQLELNIWAATDETRSAVGTWRRKLGPVSTVFAGIPEGHPALPKAIASEFNFGDGDGSGTGRALFTLLNHTFRDNRAAIMARVRQEVLATIRASDWGKN
jgi:hypothetical protein